MRAKYVLLGLMGLVAMTSGCKYKMPPEAQYPIVSDTQWIVPANIPKEVPMGASNNNLAITMYHDRLWMAFRSAPVHFASEKTKMFVVSSPDLGKTWRYEHTVDMATDVREPQLIVMNDQLIFYYVELGKDPAAFEPHHVWREIMAADGTWSARVDGGFEPETMIWEMKIRNGIVWTTAYKGNHYSTTQPSDISVFFKKSVDGINWVDVDPAHPVVYKGGVSEVGWDFDADGNFWGVGRNEDGDDSGFGSHVFFAAKDSLGVWTHPDKSNAYRFDSPRMLISGGEFYLIARRNISYVDEKEELFMTWPYDLGVQSGTVAQRRVAYLAAYSLLPKRTSVYHLNRTTKTVEWLKDLPGCSDTTFPSYVQLDSAGKKFLVANYSNPVLDNPNTKRWPWIMGQLTTDYGTQIYMTTLTFQ
jgi:hypothetical protein